ncbi:hypothetical protein P8629_04395 [Hydrogenovibrio sp. 3SP14C1]|uniref:hypothetical protein n=1 Tax=Hydrogenovibrio sp. 3SP14C1 TaxID=3038774 RepID=UPI002416D101|nr:hypothetical protein [Hydrogenovibrio sp. 3SP14C1]MDG4812238.1 hypothetical protein [Hydrogenovibrio sp. 3SP14C1]
MNIFVLINQYKLEGFIKYALLFFLFLSIVLGNQTAQIEFLGLRESQWVILILFPLAFYLVLRKELYKDFVVQILLVFIILGLFQAYRAYESIVPLKFWLAASGLYLYPLFFLISLVAFDKKDIKLIFNTIWFSTLIGITLFVGEYFYRTGQLPFLVRTSSDMLPVISAGLIASLIYCLRISLNKYLITLIPLLLFSALMFVKGAMLAIIATLLFTLFRRFLGMAVLFSVIVAASVVWFMTLHIEEYIVYANQGDIFWYNVVTRLLVWQDYFKDFLYFPSNFIFGSGITPFFSTSIYEKLTLSLFSDCSGVIHFNPHNSYLLMIHFSGVLSLALFFIFIFKVLSLKSIVMDKQLSLLIPLTVFFLMLAMTTPVFELHYMAPIFWVLLGAVYRYRQSN